MLKERVKLQQKVDEDSPSGSIITRSYIDFASLVRKSYLPRFTELSKAAELLTSTEAQVPKGECVSPTPDKEPDAIVQEQVASLEVPEDLLDMQAGLKTQEVYRKQGRSAFVPLKTYTERRKRRSV